MISDEILYEFCKDHYYCDAEEEGGERPLWAPFEFYSEDQVEEYIENDVYALKRFLKHHLEKEWDEQSN